MTDAWRWAQRNPSAVLLYVQLGGLLLYPFLEGPSDKLGTLVLSLPAPADKPSDQGRAP